MHRLKPSVLLVLPAGMAGILILVACSPNVPQPGPLPNPTQLVTRPTALPTRAVVASTSVAVDGVLTLTVPTIALGFDVSSVVVSVTAARGQSVKKGDVLATVD